MSTPFIVRQYRAYLGNRKFDLMEALAFGRIRLLHARVYIIGSESTVCTLD